MDELFNAPIFHNIFKSIQNYFFSWFFSMLSKSLKIENDKKKIAYGVKG